MRVLHYYSWGYFEPISCGADVIASNQLEYFRRRGWDVDLLMLAHADRAHQAAAFHRRYPWLRSVRLAKTSTGEFSFRGQLCTHERIARSQVFQGLAREGHDLFLTNYAFSAPLAAGMPRRCIKLLEALDIITDSFALSERCLNPQRDNLAQARDSFCWNVELELYRLFDRILFLNAHEVRLVESLCPGRAAAVPPMMPWEIDFERGWPSERSPQPIVGESYDLIFVGSPAPPNVSGLTLFYQKVFLPYLRKHRVRMAVIGKVCARLEFQDWYATKLGNVPGDLRDYYERSKVVIIPIFEGSGLSIKTIECLAHGRAVATTPVGARGLPCDPESFLQLDMAADPRGAALAILDLLSSDAKRARMQRKAQAYYRAHFGSERYFNAMDAVMESLGVASPIASVAADLSTPRNPRSSTAGTGEFSVHLNTSIEERVR